MLDIHYKITSDYSSLNPSKYIKLNKIYNLVIIPKIDEYKFFFDIKPTNLISINNLKQKVALDCGFIELDNKEYFYFYIAPGYKITHNQRYILSYKDKSINLDTTPSGTFTAKLLFGLLILPDNFYYLFQNHKKVLLSNSKIFYEIYINNIINKYNFYMANKNNTIINILNNFNYKAIKMVNNILDDAYIKPLYNSNYPLGKLEILLKGVKDNRYGVRIQSPTYNKTFAIYQDKPLIIDDLSFGTYSINFFDKNGPSLIGYCNSNLLNKDSFEIKILQIQSGDYLTQSSLNTFIKKNNPNKDTANLVINLPIQDKFKLFGPNNFYMEFDSGYQYLQNIQDGYYTIEHLDQIKQFYVIKNDNNYIS